MALTAAPTYGRIARPSPTPPQPAEKERKGWPLRLLYIAFPLWWAMGLSQAIFFIVAAVMAWQLWRRRLSLVPHGFGIWLLFLAWMGAGVLLLWAHAPGTVPGGGIARLFGYAVRAGWYAVVTIVMLYVANTSRELPTLRVVRLLGYMFIVTAAFGFAAVLAPNADFPSLAELVLPHAVTSSNFIYALIHPSLASNSEFLGYVQPRPTAPFPFSNA